MSQFKINMNHGDKDTDNKKSLASVSWRLCISKYCTGYYSSNLFTSTDTVSSCELLLMITPFNGMISK